MNRSPVQDTEAQETAFLISYKIAPKKGSSLLKSNFSLFFFQTVSCIFSKNRYFKRCQTGKWSGCRQRMGL